MMNEETITLDGRFISELRALQDETAPAFISQLIDLYLAQGREMLVELKGCLRSRNTPGLARVAHTFRGSSGCLGAMRLRALCADLEADLHAETCSAHEARVCEIETEFERVRQALEETRKA
jgi:HPt (histidine-containing phosphotransfer) domain-containing protein